MQINGALFIVVSADKTGSIDQKNTGPDNC
jgi:hypothetical protein